LFKQIAFVFLGCIPLAAQSTQPLRKVQRNVIISASDPAARIQVPPSAHYVGADRWILYGIADCELHAFVEADSQKNVQRLYWVQFEGYVPSRPELHHTYDSPTHTDIGGLDFYVDTWVRSMESRARPGSDGEHIQALIRGKGFHMPDGMISVRLVHLLDQEKRKELMLIYSENVAKTGFTVSDLQEGGKAHDRWQAIQEALVQRAKQKIIIDPK
jgi:hypothetical protein